MIKVFSTKTCPWCIVTKNYLKSKGVEFADLDVSSDKEAALEMIQKSGQRGVPVVEINNEIIIGFDQERIDTLLSTT
jgi:glutaredoxin-like YruB-family protein